ncbi:MAG TPA: hypothetical protein PK990_10720 [Salinivirgaceae bacterium]|nr:hypothetical protein [Salinivirgaceae bacterium]
MNAELHQTIHQAIDALRQEVTENLKIMRDNEKKARQLLHENGFDPDARKQIDALYDKNRELLKINKEAINLQLQMVNYLNALRGIKPMCEEKITFSPQMENLEQNLRNTYNVHNEHSYSSGNVTCSKNIISFDEVFEKTINGELEYNENHIYFNDDDFYKKLMNHFIEIENYEMCAKIARE